MGSESLPKLVLKEEMDATSAAGNSGTAGLAGLHVKRVKSSADRTIIPDSLFVCSARVVNNTVHRMDNYITIDRGENDGVRTGLVPGCLQVIVSYELLLRKIMLRFLGFYIFSIMLLNVILFPLVLQLTG